MRFEPLRIVDIRQETADTISVALAIPEERRSDFAFRPGQYLTLRTSIDGEELRRSYSICSGLDDKELRVAIKRVGDGRFSAWAHDVLRVGAMLEVMPPAGRFGVEPPDGMARLYLGVAAGSGITPVLSILKSTLAREPRSRFILLYGSRATGQIIFREQLEELKDRFMGRLSVIHVLSREQQDVPVLNGHLDGAKVLILLGGLADITAIDHAFLCGPAGMIDGVQAALAAAGIAVARIHSERFTPAAPAVSRPRPPVAATAAPHGTAVIIADGTSTEVPFDADETVLEAALRAGLDLPYSCRGGMCSTCRARVTSGSVEMEVNYALEPWETDAGYVLTCQARPTTDRLTVDYDHV